ncbi:MAG: hypothetical protein P9X22_00480 [Candidatus Zapsychrus exili]|nr:hypothetical protein [Candidatus Zapsychrus exili]
MIIKKVGIFSLGKVLGIINAGIGVIVGVFVLIASLLGAIEEGPSVGALAMFLLPVMYGLAGFLGGVLSAWLFNLGAGLVGGLEIETE